MKAKAKKRHVALAARAVCFQLDERTAGITTNAASRTLTHAPLKLKA
jgi:hypothetical protein